MHIFQAQRTVRDDAVSDATIDDVCSAAASEGYLECGSLDELEELADNCATLGMGRSKHISKLTKDARAASWCALYLVATGRSNDWDAVERMRDAASRMSTIQKHKYSSAAGLNILDPARLTGVRNSVVASLRARQVSHVDPYIVDRLSLGKRSAGDASTVALDLKFGREELAPWLELATRMINIPMRVQCSVDLVDHTFGGPEMLQQTDYVCKLIRVPSTGQYCRVFYMDKVGKTTHKPIKVPLGPLLSAYFWFYLSFCRTPLSLRAGPFRSHVFHSAKGSRWSKASRDLKAYLEDKLSINVTALDPAGRFIHGTRHIGIATYSRRVGFDLEKIRKFATLCRHSLATVDAWYSIWRSWAEAGQAVGDFSQAFNLALESGQEVPLDSTASDLEYTSLRDAPEVLVSDAGISSSASRDLVGRAGTKTEGAPGVAVVGPRAASVDTRDAFTQTNMLERGQASPAPCVVCGSVLQVYQLSAAPAFHGGNRRPNSKEVRMYCACPNSESGERGCSDLGLRWWFPLSAAE
jgi:hypothetical protein